MARWELQNGPLAIWFNWWEMIIFPVERNVKIDFSSEYFSWNSFENLKKLSSPFFFSFFWYSIKISYVYIWLNKRKMKWNCVLVRNMFVCFFFLFHQWQYTCSLGSPALSNRFLVFSFDFRFVSLLFPLTIFL